MTDPVSQSIAQGDATDALALLLFVPLALAEDADRTLSIERFNRTHHRILFLIDRRPGVTVGEIVSLLRLTQQAIQAPLRTLLKEGLIQQESAERDRRKRHLSTTAQGQSLLAEMSSTQFARIDNALTKAGPESVKHFLSVMRSMMNENDHDWLYPPVNSRNR